jgi:hypothetical protein
LRSPFEVRHKPVTENAFEISSFLPGGSQLMFAADSILCQFRPAFSMDAKWPIDGKIVPVQVIED